MPVPKSSNTCSQCRSRKVRCEGGPGPCANCERLSFTCSFGDVSSSPTAESSSRNRPERRRGARACVECRSQKSRCSGELPSCGSCRRRSKSCVYSNTGSLYSADQRSSPRGAQSGVVSGQQLGNRGNDTAEPLSPGHPSFDHGLTSPSVFQNSPTSIASSRLVDGHDSSVPPIREQLRLVNDFFQHIYPLPMYSFLNEPSIAQRCLDGTLDEALLLALLAVSALHLKYMKYFPTFTASWIQRAEAKIWSRIAQPSIFLTQAMMLVILYRIEVGDFQKAFMICALAARAASALRLHYERTDLSPLAQEIRRRVMWCLMSLDVHFSVGLPECELCPYEVIYLKFPCKEEDFISELEPRSQSLDGIPEGGLFTFITQQVTVRRDVMRLRRQVTLSGQALPQLTAIVDDFRRSLQAMSPGEYKSEELHTYSRSRWLVRYVAAHLSWHQCHCDVYRLFLSGYKEAAPSRVVESLSASYVADAVAHCLFHSRAILRILDDLSKLNPGLLVPYMDVAICGYHASRLVLFLSRSSLNPPDSGLTPDIASTQASAVLQLLKSLFWASQLVKHLLSDMERILHLHLEGQREQSQDPVDVDEEAPNQRAQFARAARRHQRLGIHSMLRQARFVDDSHKAAELSDTQHVGSGSPKGTSIAGEGIITRGHNLASGDLQFGHATTTSDHHSATQASSLGPDFRLNFTDMMINDQNDFHFSDDCFDMGTPGGWQEIWRSNEHSTSADGDYF